MEFEELILRPVSGSVDEATVTAWLDAQPHACRDPLDGAGWWLAATPRAVAKKRQERLDHPGGFMMGVRVWVFPDRVGISAVADLDDLSRAYELVAWLVRDAAWTVQLDRNPPEAVGDARRWFPASMPDASALPDDATESPVVDGTLVSLDGATDATMTLSVHSSGAWCHRRRGRTLSGRLSDGARAAFDAALRQIDPDEDPSPSDAAPGGARLEIETTDGVEWVHFGADGPPPSFRPLAALLARWLDVASRWRDGDVVDDWVMVRAAERG